MDFKHSPNETIDSIEVVFATMQQEHIGQIADMERLCFGEEAWSYELMLGEFTDATKRYFVALASDEVVGYIGYAHIIDEAHIMNVAVKEGFRKQGIGSRLLDCLLEDCKERNIIAATLEVNQTNFDAISLYEKYGFLLAGKRKNYYRNTYDALIYWKKL